GGPPASKAAWTFARWDGTGGSRQVGGSRPSTRSSRCGAAEPRPGSSTAGTSVPTASRRSRPRDASRLAEPRVSMIHGPTAERGAAMIEMTPVAAEKLRELRGTDPSRAFLRMYVAGKSCCSYQYGLAFDA